MFFFMYLVEIELGVFVGEKIMFLFMVGLYVFRGKGVFFFMMLMLVVLVWVVGVKKIVVCIFFDKEGKVELVFLVIVCMVGVDEVYKLGGV